MHTQGTSTPVQDQSTLLWTLEEISHLVSRSGNATPAPGDLFGVSGPVKTGATQVALQIDQVHP